MAKDDRVSGKKYKPLSSARRCFRSASVGATRAVIKAWADKYEQRDRGNLSEEDWWEIAAAVNSRDQGRWTVESCKNRIRKVKTRYEREKAAGLSSWIFFKWLDKLLGPASDAEDVWELWELDEAVTETAGPVAELARKLRGFEARMKELTGRGSDELVQALARLEQAWSGFAASVANAAAAEDDSSKTEEDLGADCGPGDQDGPADGAAGRQTVQPSQTAEREPKKSEFSSDPAPESGAFN
uniref:Myb/SANT-like DNA-binding domain-containing protein n=1 Tax=Ananas comosus var. bracteatus TaxID=296719 RepID=A0A6V7P5F7_ANACO|nr:unnamed protein product [Ananas comosus var. bracteatus]